MVFHSLYTCDVCNYTNERYWNYSCPKCGFRSKPIILTYGPHTKELEYYKIALEKINKRIEFEKYWEKINRKEFTMDVRTGKIYSEEEISEMFGSVLMKDTRQYLTPLDINQLTAKQKFSKQVSKFDSRSYAGKKRIVANKKMRNQPCPCGSGLKYKNCHCHLLDNNQK